MLASKIIIIIITFKSKDPEWSLGLGVTARDLTINKLPQTLSLMLSPIVKVPGDVIALCV